jgi:hypothetical protein
MKVYFTFGQIHTHSVNGKTLDKNCVAVIEGETYEAAREKGMQLFDRKFHNSSIMPPNMIYYPSGIIETGVFA